MAILEACNSNKHDVISLIVDSINPYSFDMNILVIMFKRGLNKKVVEQLLRIFSVVVQPEIIDFARQALKNENLEIIQWLIENLQSFLSTYSNNCFNLKSALNNACKRKGTIKVVEYLLQNVVHTQLDMRTAIAIAIDRNNLNIVKLLLNNDSHRSIDVNRVMIDACRFDGSKLIEIINVLLANIDQTFFDIETINKIFHRACRKAELDIIKILVKHFDNKLLDMKTAMTNACFNDNVEEVRSIAENVDNAFLHTKTSLNLDKLKIMKFLADTVNNHFLGIDTVMRKACSEGNLTVVQWIAENVDNTLFDVKTALEYAIGDDVKDDDYRNFDLINFLLNRLEDEDMSKITNLNKLMSLACYNFKCHAVQLLTEKVDNSLLGIDTVMNDLDLAMWLLAKIDDKEIDMNTSFINACSKGNHDLLELLLETSGRQYLDAKTALNVSCINGHFSTVKYLLENFDIQHFDFATAMIKVCRSQSKDSVEIGKCLWNKFNHNVFDLAKAMNNACRYGNLDVAKWIFEMTNIDVFVMSEALNSACQCDKDVLVKWIISNIPTEKFNVQTAIKYACRNHSNNLSIIKCFVKGSRKINLDLNILVKEACTYERTDVIEWMLENCDKDSFRILDLLTSLVNIDNSLETNVIDKHDKSKRDSKKQNLILKILKNNTYLSCDYNSILSKACSEGWIDIFRWILTEIDNTELNITDAVNIASKNGRCELINWSLSNLNPDQIDSNTILVEASGFGFIEVVQSISSRPDKCKLNFKNAMNDACEYGRGEVVTWLLKNNAKDMFDLSTVISGACKTGWMDTLNWILENADYMLLNIDCAIIEACAAGNIDIVRVLFSTFGKDHFDQLKLSTRICEKVGNEKVVLFLLENLNADGFQMDNILNKASGFGWLEVVSWIMENGLEINTVGAAFETACVNCEIDIVKYLQDTNSRENIQTGLQTACKSGFEEIVEVLLDSLHHKHLDMAPLLNEACRCGEQTVVEVLLRKVDNALFDKRAAINEACRSKLPEDLVYFLIKDLQINDFDNEVVSENARKHSWTKVLMQLKRKS